MYCGRKFVVIVVGTVFLTHEINRPPSRRQMILHCVGNIDCEMQSATNFQLNGPMSGNSVV